MPLRVATVLLYALVARAAQPTTTVAEIITLVRNALAGRESDGALAKSLRKFSLVEKLNDRVVEELESEGAGPKTVAELEHLRDITIDLAAPTERLPFTVGVRP